jgi:membrane-associated phospholipid phosphatase
MADEPKMLPSASVSAVAAPVTGSPIESSGTGETRHRRLEWDERWRRFRAVEYVETAATGIASVAVFWFAKPSDRALWTSPILFDTAVRNAFRLRTRTGLTIADTSSSILAYVTPSQVALDTVLLSAASKNFDVMWQLGMMDLESYSLSGLVVATLYDTTGRARPSYADCKAGTSVDPMCNSGELASFPSGHTAVAMTGAGLLCAHHGALPLYGGGALDVAACVEGLTLATTVGVLRLMGDRHYASDVLIGGAIGFFSGYALPRLLHYWKRPPTEVIRSGELRMSILPGNGGTPLGVQALGIF